MELKVINKNNKKEWLIIIVLIILLGAGVFYHFNRMGKKNDRYEAQVKLTEALTDSVRTYKTERGELISEKRTLQGNLKDLQDENINLSREQRDLLETVDRINKERKREREIFAAARIEYQAFIDSLNRVIAGATSVDTINNTVSFVEDDTAAHFIYDFDIMGVRPFPLTVNPEIRINKLNFPNTQTITFNFDKNKRKDYPVSFSVMNTNPYYEPLNIESYAIEGLTKDNINPTTGKKIWNWVKINGKYILVGAAGFAVGSVLAQ